MGLYKLWESLTERIYFYECFPRKFSESIDSEGSEIWIDDPPTFLPLNFSLWHLRVYVLLGTVGQL